MTDLKWNFPPSSKKDWLAKASLELKDKSVSDLVETIDDIEVAPYYDLQDVANYFYPKINHYSKFVPDEEMLNFYCLSNKEPKLLNQEILAALQKGANALCLDFNTIDENTLQTSLNEVVTDIIHFDLNVNDQPSLLVENIMKFNKDGHLIKKGALSFLPGTEILRRLIDWAQDKPGFFPLTISDPETGNHYARRNALMISRLVEVVDQLNDEKVSPEKILAKVRFKFNIGLNYFFDSARIRAFATVLDEVIGAYKISLKPQVIFHGECYPWTDEKYEPHENMIRGTSGIMAAMIGGCNSLSLHPVNIEDPLQRRVAWNTFHVLKYEARIDKVEDPGRGAYFFEVLTRKLTEKTLEDFKNIEGKGGWSACIKEIQK